MSTIAPEILAIEVHCITAMVAAADWEFLQRRRHAILVAIRDGRPSPPWLPCIVGGARLTPKEVLRAQRVARECETSERHAVKVLRKFGFINPQRHPWRSA